MRTLIASLLLLSLLAVSDSSPTAPTYRVRNQELGIAYTPPVPKFDTQQWDSVFSDPAPPMGWIFLPIGKESCNAIFSGWLEKARARNFQLGVVLVPFLNVSDIKKTVDCAAAKGFRRAVLDEYVSYQTRNLGRPLCTVLSEVQSVYQYSKTRHPSFEFDIDDNWLTWVTVLNQGQSNGCGAYPYFKVDQAGVSVLSKYGNPAQDSCGHPTAAEIQEQLLDLKPILHDYSRRAKIFAWQLNQNWYPGGEDVLQTFRQLKPVFGIEPFLLYGPTSTNDGQDNWGYRVRGSRENCSQNNFEWFLPARDYLIRIREGLKTFITLNGPTSISRGSAVTLNGRLKTMQGIPGTVEMQIIPVSGAKQVKSAEVVAPPGARLAFVGVRANVEVPHDIRGSADLLLNLVQLFEKSGGSNLVANPDFNDGFSKWLSLSTGSITVVSDGNDKSMRIQANPQQSISLTSAPIIVHPGRSYLVNFHTKLFSESRNNGYFFIAWNSFNEIKRDRLFMKFPDRQTIAATNTRNDGNFSFVYQPAEPGTYNISAFFRGTRIYQPSIASLNINVN